MVRVRVFVKWFWRDCYDLYSFGIDFVGVIRNKEIRDVCVELGWVRWVMWFGRDILVIGKFGVGLLCIVEFCGEVVLVYRN